VAGYRVYRDGTLAATTAATSYTAGGLAANTSYVFTVAAFDAAGNSSAQSAARQVTTAASTPVVLPPAADSSAPTRPAGLAAAGVTTSQVTVSWLASTDNVGVAGYRVYRDGLLAATVAATSFVNSGLAPNTSYVFTVVAFDAAGNSSVQSASLPVTTAATATTADPGSTSGAASYATFFPGSENPLSEGGNWVSPASGVWHKTMRSIGGVGAFGDPAAYGLDDSVSVLTGSGYLKDQTITAAVHKVAGDPGATELELHLRLSFNATQIFTYEVDLIPNGLNIAKWTGNQGSYLLLPLINGTNGVFATPLQDGDVFVATISGDSSLSTITVTQNGTLIARANDSAAISGSAAYVSGNPGIGGDNATSANLLAWKSYSVSTH
jgi:chitodextrinase